MKNYSLEYESFVYAQKKMNSNRKEVTNLYIVEWLGLFLAYKIDKMKEML